MQIEEYISTIRNSFSGSVKVYTEGSCYQFYKILKIAFPQAEAYYNSDHVITKIGNRFYDITGEVQKINHLEMDEHYPNSTVKDCRYNNWI